MRTLRAWSVILGIAATMAGVVGVAGLSGCVSKPPAFNPSNNCAGLTSEGCGICSSRGG